MNLILSYSQDASAEFTQQGHRLLGSGVDEKGVLVEIFLKSGYPLVCSASGAPEQPVRRRQFRQMAGNEPFFQATLEKRIDAICGCVGADNCCCVSVFNQAKSELWYEYNVDNKRDVDAGISASQLTPSS